MGGNIVMPIPKPKKEEKQREFINRCMESIGNEYDDPKQALAVCFSEFKKDNAIDFDNIYDNDLYNTKMDIERKNYHSGRVRNPGEFQQESFRTKTLPGESAVIMVVGRLKGKTTTTVQTYLFPKEKYTPAQAKAWLKENNVKTIKFEKAKEGGDGVEKKDNADNKIVQRFDFHDIMEYGLLNGLEEPFQKTKEGYLSGRAIVTNIGVFPYRNSDGTIRHELRHPDEIMDSESLETLRMKPISNNHPDELVIDTENIKQHQVGFTGSEVKNDAYHISIPISITDQKAIDDVNKGKRALSAGYSLMLEEKPGTWMGVHYDAIQRNIRYNHVAIVDRGRAGDAAKIRMDSSDKRTTSYYISWNNDSAQNNEKEDKTLNENLNLKKITLDGVEYTAETEVIKTVNGLQKQVDTLEKELTDLKTEKSTLEADRDTLKDKVDQLEKTAADEKQIEERVQKRIVILTAAEMARINTDGKTEKEIMSEVILTVFSKADLKDRDDGYILGRFEGAVDELEKKVDANKTKTFFSHSESSGEGEIISADEARQKMMKEIYNDSRGIKEKGGK